MWITEAGSTRRNSSDALALVLAEGLPWPCALCLSHSFFGELFLVSDLIGLLISQISFTQLFFKLKKE
jgi:hypothetical protein